jgi:hypothetical protein
MGAMDMKKAIVATSHFTDSGTRNEETLNTWIEYHLKEFDKIFIFVDKHEQWKRYYKNHKSIIFLVGYKDHNEQNYRQVYNVNTALRLCLELGIDWLLHIDDDELFYDTSGSEWMYFPVEQIHFRDLELLQTKNEIVNRFTEAEPLFKVYDRYRTKSGYPYFGYHFCKSAVRVRPWTRNGQITTHFFTHERGAAIYSDASFILHYGAPTFQGWLETYLRSPRMSKKDWNPDEFWYQSSHIVHDAQAEGNMDRAYAFWERAYPQERNEIEDLLARELLVRIDPFTAERAKIPPLLMS